MSEATLLQERLITHFAAENRRATFTPDRIFIETPEYGNRLTRTLSAGIRRTKTKLLRTKVRIAC